MSNANWIVKNVVPNDDFTLTLTFITGEKKIYDAKQLFSHKFFEPLKDINLFKKAHVDGHTVAWNDLLDIDPEDLYDEGVPIN